MPVRVLAAALTVPVVAVIFRAFQHAPYAAGSPTTRITVATGCPPSLGAAVDVRNSGPSWWSELWSYSRLAPAGASSGLVCEYAPAASGSPPAGAGTRLGAARLLPAQAAAVAVAAHGVSTKRPSGTFHCPAEDGRVVIVVLAYANRSDEDIWWNASGCQSADNGHVQVYQAANDSFGDFQDAVLSAIGPLP